VRLVFGSYLPNIFLIVALLISLTLTSMIPPTLSLAHDDVSTLSPRQLELAPETRCSLLWMQWGSEDP
jgi:hypothetical protein